MKEYDILNAIGDVDETAVKNAKVKRKSRRRIFICAGSLAACAAVAISVGFASGYFGTWGVASQIPADESKDTLAPAHGYVPVYYVQDGKIAAKKHYLQLSAEGVFTVWREENGIGDEVELIDVNIQDNGKATVDESTAQYEAGDRFVLNLTVSNEIEAYYDKTDSELLLDSLEQTMCGYQNIDFDEYNLILA